MPKRRVLLFNAFLMFCWASSPAKSRWKISRFTILHCFCTVARELFVSSWFLAQKRKGTKVDFDAQINNIFFSDKFNPGLTYMSVCMEDVRTNTNLVLPAKERKTTMPSLELHPSITYCTQPHEERIRVQSSHLQCITWWRIFWIKGHANRNLVGVAPSDINECSNIQDSLNNHSMHNMPHGDASVSLARGCGAH